MLARLRPGYRSVSTILVRLTVFQIRLAITGRRKSEQRHHTAIAAATLEKAGVAEPKQGQQYSDGAHALH